MITENDFNQELRNSMTSEFKSILIDFVNNFLNTFKGILTKEEVLDRINALKYIGFEGTNPNYLYFKCSGNQDARYENEMIHEIIISKRHINSDKRIIKSLLYHELLHAVSEHIEKDEDTLLSGRMWRTGLKREVVPYKSGEPGFNETEILDEIMTEYYNTIMLKNEGIDLDNRKILNSNCFFENYVEYHGTGYIEMAELGRIYDLMFGEELMKAKFIDGNEFRKKFNEIFKDTNVFANIFNDEGYDVPNYSKFVAQRDVIERYKTACKMFVVIFKNKHMGDINSIDDLLGNEEFQNFLNMLVKTRSKIDNSTKVNEELYLLTKELETTLALELFGKQMNENEFGLDTRDIETIIYLTIERIFGNDKNINLDNVKYSVFYDNNFKGILLIVNDKKILIDYKTLGQDFDYVEFQKFSGRGLSQEELDNYSSEYGIDISNAEFATTTDRRKMFIIKDGKLYNHYGQELELSQYQNYFVEDESKSR